MTSFNISTPQTGSSSGASWEVNKALQYKDGKTSWLQTEKNTPYKRAIGCWQWFEMIVPLIKLLNKYNCKTITIRLYLYWPRYSSLTYLSLPAIRYLKHGDLDNSNSLALKVLWNILIKKYCVYKLKQLIHIQQNSVNKRAFFISISRKEELYCC